LHDALLDAFRTSGDFKRVVSFGLNTSLEQIAGSGTLAEQVLLTIQWAEAHSRVDDLIAAALLDNPDNPRLRQFDSTWRTLPQAEKQALDDDSAPDIRAAKPSVRGLPMRPSLVSTSEDLVRLLNFGASWMCSALATLVVVYLVAVDRAPWWSVIVTIALILPVMALVSRGSGRTLSSAN
jgi:hypothetical protein